MINEALRLKAESLKPRLIHKQIRPVALVEVNRDETTFMKYSAKKISDVTYPISLKGGESIVLDFGNHYTGYLNLSTVSLGQICDSPVKLRFIFGEMPHEIGIPPEEYKGWIGKGWIQEDFKPIVFMPYKGSLERRYSARFLKIERLDNAPFPVGITDIYMDATSAVDLESAPKLNSGDELYDKIYNISLNTLKECEQDVFEDGPKRDRRLWIGDLRVQALTDYYTFKNINLIKRCIYLFASCIMDCGLVPPYVFQDSPPYVDNWKFQDYSLYLVSCLYDYLTETKDEEFVKELWPIAEDQIEKAIGFFMPYKENYVDRFFIDWCPDLDKAIASMCTVAYVVKQAIEVKKHFGMDTKVYEGYLAELKKAINYHYDKESGFYTKGQLSWHSQVWAVLAEAIEGQEAKRLLIRTKEADPQYKMQTPYMMNFYIEAMVKCGMKDEALSYIREIWGGIIDAGFDTCPEYFDPKNPEFSSYGGHYINSCCHAWSCTPAYRLKKLL